MKCPVSLTFKGLQKVFGHIPADSLKVGELKEVWSLQSAFHLVTPTVNEGEEIELKFNVMYFINKNVLEFFKGWQFCNIAASSN